MSNSNSVLEVINNHFSQFSSLSNNFNFDIFKIYLKMCSEKRFKTWNDRNKNLGERLISDALTGL